MNSAARYGEGRAIAPQLADGFSSVKVRLAVIRYACAPRFLHLTKIFYDDDEFFTPIEVRPCS